MIGVLAALGISALFIAAVFIWLKILAYAIDFLDDDFVNEVSDKAISFYGFAPPDTVMAKLANLSAVPERAVPHFAPIPEEKYQREHTEQAAVRWQREGCPVQFGPVTAWYYGLWPDHLHSLRSDWGALGVANDRLWFIGAGTAGFEIRVPLSTIRWVSQLAVQRLPVMPLTVYPDGGDTWRIYLFGLNDSAGLAQAMQAAAQVPVSGQVDCGPTQAVSLRQDIYGQWQRGYTLPLYLAPDRLLAGWHTAARLDSIRGLALLPSAGFTKTALLRIDHTDPEGRPQVIGFEMKYGQAVSWGDVLRQRTGAKVENVLGRKKK